MGNGQITQCRWKSVNLPGEWTACSVYAANIIQTLCTHIIFSVAAQLNESLPE